jgi:hypothetical protein
LNTGRAVCIAEIIAMVCSSVGAVGSGHSWLLFGTVPVGAVGAWMFARSGSPVPR